MPATTSSRMSAFLSRHRLPAAFRNVAEQHYLPLAMRLPGMRGAGHQLTVGISGAQGTGKSTLADFLSLATEGNFGWNVAVLSIDDFYYTLAERDALASEIHPLLATRGVPGTHDTGLLRGYLERLRRLQEGERLALPRFDKSVDDRAHVSRWPVVEGPVDLVILEGWCVGTEAQSGEELLQPVNALERDEDPDGTWRKYVNDQLRQHYESIFSKLDVLIFLSAPSFDAIHRWRSEQEEKLAANSPHNSPAVMNTKQLARFIQFYERLTRATLIQLPGKADVVFQLDDNHALVG